MSGSEPNQKLVAKKDVEITTKSSASVDKQDDGATSITNGRILPQVLCTAAASFGNFNIGITLGWSSNALPDITDDPQFKVGNLASACIVGLVSLGALLGCLGAGRVLDHIGRRSTLMAASPLMALGWGMIALAPNLELIYAGRFISGFSSGFILTGGQIYSSETCQSRIRGRLGSLPSLCLTVGILFCYIITGSFHWRTSSYIAAGVSLAFLAVMFFAPKSPYWLLMKNKNSQAKETLEKLRGSNYNTIGELNEMENKLLSVGKKVKYSELLKPRTRYPFAIAMFIMFAQQINGVQIVMRYTGTILRAADSSLNPKLGTIYTGVAQVIGALLALTVVDRLERKTLMAISLSFIGLSMVTMASYFIAIKVFETTGPGWFPTAIMMSIVFFYCLGCRSVPWILSSEVFNTSIRSRAHSVCVTFNRILNFIIIQIYPFFADGAGVHTVMYVFGTLSILCAVACIMVIPKTRGKTLEEIQQYFESKATTNHKRNKKQDDIQINVEENKFL